VDTAWRSTYWITFVLCWLVLPIIQATLTSGYNTTQSKLRDAVSQNIRFYAIATAVLLLVIIILFASTTSISVFHLLIALSNTYGLLLALLLLGYGLVSVPRSLYHRSHPEIMLEQRYLLATSLDTDLFECVWNLQDVEGIVDAVVNRRDSANLSYDVIGFLDDLKFRRDSGVADLVGVEHRRTARSPSSSSNNTSSSRSNSGGDNYSGRPLLDPSCELTIQNLAELNRTLMAAQADVRVAVRAHEHLVDEIAYYSSLGDNLVAPLPTSAGQDASCCDSLLSAIERVYARLKYLYQKHLRTLSLQIAAFLLSILSGVVLWSELFMGLPVNLSPFGSMMKGIHASRSIEILALLPLVYMSFCVYSSLFKVRLFGRQGLKKKQSDGPSLCFSASYLVRMQFPLCYNYLLMLRYDASKSTAFMGLMQSIDTIPIAGTTFSTYAPLICVLLCVATFFNFYGRFLASLGIDTDDAILYGGAAEDKEERIREGKVLLRRSLQKRDANGGDRIGRGGERAGGGDVEIPEVRRGGSFYDKI
jgi:hypothetical protein